ncbi:MAG: P-loop NTPase, partial [Myxococcales bacterium]|nr:P-loop NTPase [Myxococcales bacterium]
MGRPAARVLEAIKFATMRPTHPFTMTIQRNPGRLIAVGGGKGGVGKSVVSSNLAIAIAALGAKVTVIDLDLGAANLHTLFGIARPEVGLQDFLDREVELAETTTRTSAYGVSLIAGSSQVGVANISHKQKQRLMSHIRQLPGDVILLDLGAGTTFNTLDFVDLADLRVVVMTPQMTSLQNAYSFLKAAVHRSVQLAADTGEEREVLATAVAQVKDTQRMGTLMAALAARSPVLARRCESLLAHYGTVVVGNQVRDDRDVQIIGNMARMIRDFLQIPAPIQALIRDSAVIRDSVNARRPMLLEGGGAAATELRRLAQALLAPDVARLRHDRRHGG